MEILVECYAGYQGDETPRRFRTGERDYEVERVIDRWREPDYRCFKVLGQDGAIYILRQHVESWRWELASPT